MAAAVVMVGGARPGISAAVVSRSLGDERVWLTVDTYAQKVGDDADVFAAATGGAD